MSISPSMHPPVLPRGIDAGYAPEMAERASYLTRLKRLVTSSHPAKCELHSHVLPSDIVDDRVYGNSSSRGVKKNSVVRTPAKSAESKSQVSRVMGKPETVLVQTTSPGNVRVVDLSIKPLRPGPQLEINVVKTLAATKGSLVRKFLSLPSIICALMLTLMVGSYSS